jgi:ABC-type multidrug transport system fused ATPase/permease subunit
MPKAFKQPPHPDEVATFFSKLIFGWMTPLMATGSRRELEIEDVFAPRKQDECEAMMKKVHELVAVERKKPRPSFATVVWAMIRTEYLAAMVLAIPYLVCFALQPKFIGAVLLALEGKEDPWFPGWSGLAHACLLAAVTAVQGVCMQHLWSRLITCSVKLRAFGMGYVFSKALNLAPHARQSYSVGTLVTLMSVDLDRIFFFTNVSSWVFCSPIMICIVSVIVVSELGAWPSLGGLCVLIVLTCFQWYTAMVLKRARYKVMYHTEHRVHMIEELLQGIRVIKAYAWEKAMGKQVEKMRSKELKELSLMLILSAFNLSVMFITPVTVGLVAFFIYSSEGNALTASKVFTAFAAINLLRLPVKVIPMVIARGVESIVSFKRLTTFMCMDELVDGQLLLMNATMPPGDGGEEKDSAYSLTMHDCTFAWSPDTESFHLHVPELNIRPGSLCCVVGRVGSGKSSFLSCILGEMLKIKGHGKALTTGYVAQKAWIQNSTLRDAILFGATFDEVRYHMVLKLAELESDLDVLPQRDQTEIGERGINLSGGQKQRVAIARLLYCSQDVDICLFDDPLSAVDVHVASALFKNAICGNMLNGKTKILTLNSHYHLLDRADLIVVIDRGHMVGYGSLQDVKLLEEFVHLTERAEIDHGESAAFVRCEVSQHAGDERAATVRVKDEISEDSGISNASSADVPVISKAKPGQLIQKEDRVLGEVNVKTFIAYFSSAGDGKGGLLWGAFVMSTFVVGQGVRTIDDILLSAWTSDSDDSTLLLYYAVFALLTFVCFVFSSVIFMWSAVRASRVFHARIFDAILCAPVNNFFDVTKVGTILNRFTKDIDNIDMLLPDYQIQFIQNSLYFISASVLCIAANPIFALVFPVLLVIFLRLGNYYRAALRSLKRLESMSRSPIFSSFTEAMSGLSTIRAFRGVKERTLNYHYQCVDVNTSLFGTYWVSGNWFAMRIDLLGSTIVLCVSVLSVTVNLTGVDVSMVGLALSFAIQYTSLLQWTVRCAIETESNMTSVERLNFYADSIPFENDEGCRPGHEKPGHRSWPSKGALSLEGVVLRYREGLPVILKGLTATIEGGEKIGVVGRTGAGKSSLFLAFLRLVELEAGSITIDGIDISTVKLSCLRSVISLIPQSPFLFTGTLRVNLDPFNEFTDEEVWRALELSNLKAAVQQFPLKLQHLIADQGSNLSAGQQQLVCVGRALLRRSQVILLDEATANVDQQTDHLIQQTIKEAFKFATTITIAHRLDTVLSSDRIMVMDDGIIAEFDTPKELLANPDSIFSCLMEQWNADQSQT